MGEAAAWLVVSIAFSTPFRFLRFPRPRPQADIVAFRWVAYNLNSSTQRRTRRGVRQGCGSTGLFMWAVEALKVWHDFYVLVWTAGGTLLALLFVAVLLGAGYLTEEPESATRTFMTPVVIHFTSVFWSPSQ